MFRPPLPNILTRTTLQLLHYRLGCALVCVALSLSSLTAQTKARTKAPAATKPAAAVKSSSTAKQSAPKSSPTKTAAKNQKGKKPAPTRWVQTQPSPDRYKEIQQALAAKGYFGGTADGTWGPDSTDALKRFQKDQNIEVDGKIGALSLIALGLGPKRGTQAAATSAPPTPEP